MNILKLKKIGHFVNISSRFTKICSSQPTQSFTNLEVRKLYFHESFNNLKKLFQCVDIKYVLSFPVEFSTTCSPYSNAWQWTRYAHFMVAEIDWLDKKHMVRKHSSVTSLDELSLQPPTTSFPGGWTTVCFWKGKTK